MDKDFNMCIDEECPSKERCFRYSASPIKPGQAFFYGTPRNDEDDKCDMFVAIGRGKRTKFHRKVKVIK